MEWVLFYYPKVMVIPMLMAVPNGMTIPLLFDQPNNGMNILFHISFNSTKHNLK